MIPIIFIIACFALFLIICNYFERFDKEQQKDWTQKQWDEWQRDHDIDGID